MDLLIRSVLITDPASPSNQQTKDIFIKNGIISKIGSRIKQDKVKVIDGKGWCVSPGWFDMNVSFADPGYEHKEDIYSGMSAAAAGGFTGVACLPNTYPAIHSKSEVEYIIGKARGGMVDVIPYGAVSRDCKGDDITEIYDMRESGAVAFTDGLNSFLNAGLMQRALYYVKPFNGVIISFPDERSISHFGHMNEGVTSTVMGVSGIPNIAEELVVARDIELAAYTGSRVHFAGISTSGSVDLIRDARKRGLNVTCSVSPYNLAMDETFASDYDTNYKVNPPLRTKADIKSLKKALKEGVIQALCSFHVPQDEESKKVEFDYAIPGMITLETAYPLFNEALSNVISTDELVNKLAVEPRRILGLDIPSIKEGNKANLTFFDENEEWIFTEADIMSKSRNTPLIGKKLKGRVKGVVNNNQTNLR